MSITAIVFDFDGVLADTERLHLRATQDAFGPQGWTLDERTYFDRYLGYGDRDLVIEFVRDRGEVLRQDLLEQVVAEKARRYQEHLTAGDALFATAAACVQRLGARYPLAIASGSLQGEIRDILDVSGLTSSFKVIVGADDCEAGKPAPEPYLRAAKGLGVAPSACVAIEDSRWGLESARDAGLKTIAVTTSYPAEALSMADVIVSSLDEITEELVASLRT